ncbi:MAG: DUF1449 family protein, partial [Deltaproteobacteria bacterium]|nr:DUF1449 family protein [Deltaproteobacteria bacterium]
VEPGKELGFHKELAADKELGFHKELAADKELGFHKELAADKELGFDKVLPPGKELGFDKVLPPGKELAPGKDAAAPGGGLVGTMLDLLGVGRWPLSFLIPCWFLFFGAGGLALSFLQDAVARASLAGTLLRTAVALAGSLAGASLLARLFGRLVPKSSTAVEAAADLIGRLGKVLYEVSGEGGWVRVLDRTETIHDLRARCSGGSIAAGAEVLLVDYSPDAGLYEVEPSPFTRPGGDLLTALAARSTEGQPAAEPALPPALPAEPAAEALVGGPVEAPVEPPVGGPVEAPVEPPVGGPVEAPVEPPVGGPARGPAEPPVGGPAAEQEQAMLQQVARSSR